MVGLSSDNKEYKRYYVGILNTHPVQYYVPWYRALSAHPQINLEVFYCRYPSPQEQSKAGFGVNFNWDIPLLEGYRYYFLNNKAKNPTIHSFWGCDTPQIQEIIYRKKFDAFIVQGWNTKSYWQAIYACWKNHTPLLVRGDSQLPAERSILLRMLKYFPYRYFIKRFAGYLVVGQRSKEYYLYYGASEKKMFFVPHCVDNNFFSTTRNNLNPQRITLRKKWQIPEDKIVFLFVGKLIPRKRPQDFIQALSLVCRDCPKIFGLVVGDGILRKGLENLSKTFNLPVKFLGFLNQTELPSAYTVSDILILPSDGRETWGMVVNEAFACGLPAIVSSAVGCAPDLVIPNKTGDIFNCKDVKGLVKIIKKFALQPQYIKEMGENAQKLILNYSIENAVEKTFIALKTIIESHAE